MKRQEIERHLCLHDKRRGSWGFSQEPRPVNCQCDNCFYGRHELADTLLNALDTIDDINTQLGARLD